MARTEARVLVGTLAALVAMASVSLYMQDDGSYELLSLNLGPSSSDTPASPVQPGQLLRVDIPASQLATTKIGDVLKGTVRTQGLSGGVVAFTGSVQSGSEVSSTVGAVTVRVLSDKYVRPGTPISGRVGNSMFSGTVIGSPNTQERLTDLEKRLSSLESPSKKVVVSLHDDLADVEGRLRKLEGGKTMKDRMEYLENRINDLEHQPPSMDASVIKDNEEGFHFHGSIGPNVVEPDVNSVEGALSAIEKAPGPDEAVRPVVNRLDEVEERMNDLEDSTHPKHTIANLEKRLVALEKQAIDPN